MTEDLDRIAAHFGVSVADEIAILRSISVSRRAARLVVQRREVLRIWFELDLPDLNQLSAERRGSFRQVLSMMLTTHFEIELELEQHLHLAAAVPLHDETLVRLESMFDALAHLVGLDGEPYAALGALDLALDAGDVLPAPSPIASAEPESAEPSRGWSVERDGDRVRVEVSLRAVKTNQGAEIGDALVTDLYERTDVAFAVQSADESSVVVIGSADEATVREIELRVERIARFLHAGIDPATVLPPREHRLVPTSAPIPSQRIADVSHGHRPVEPGPSSESERRPQRAPSRPAPSPAYSPAPGEAVDVWLRTPGYDDSRIRQVISVLLSVNIVQAAEICQSSPCLLLPDVSANRAGSVLDVVKRAGGKAVLVPVGEVPEFARRR